MKRIHWICMVSIFLLSSCNKETGEIVLQEIDVRGCLGDSGGTWYDNIVELDSRSASSLSFVVKSTGILKFEHKKNEVIVDHAFISVESGSLKRQILFTQSHYSYKKCNAGLVDERDTITIRGYDVPVKIKCIRIVATDSFLEDDF